MFFDPMGWYRSKARPVLSKLGNLSATTFNRAMSKAPPKLYHAALAKIKKLYEEFGVGNVAAALRFAKAQDGKPYIWGGVGPRGFDCSGLQSALTNVIQGSRNPYHRRFTTASFGGGRGVAGFRQGMRSNYMVGVNPASHMAGTLFVGNRKFNVEAGGTAGGVGVNGSAGGAFSRSWAYRFGLSRAKRRALGGMLGSGQWAVAGENGPEMIRLRNPGRVFSTPQSQRIINSHADGGSTYVQVDVHVSPTSDARAVGREIDRVLSETKRSNGGYPLNFERMTSSKRR